MRVAIALSLLAFILVLLILALYTMTTIKNLGNMINATLYYENGNYYLTFNITNELPITMYITVIYDGINKSLTLNPFTTGSLTIPVELGGIVNVTISIPGLVNETTGVKI